MFGFAYGSKENGAVFAHMAVMYANALYGRGFVKEGYKVINSLYCHLSDFEKSRIYPGIPEYIGENGRGLYHYLTGSASWLLLTVFNEMFGVKGYYGNLVLEPKLLKEQFSAENKAEVSFQLHGRKFTVCYYNRNAKEYGEYEAVKVSFNGSELPKVQDKIMLLKEDIIKLKEDITHVIEVELI